MINTQLLITERTEAGLSQRQLAKLAGVNRETIRRLEHGADASQLPLGVVFRIAAALDVEAPVLLLRDAGASADAGPAADLLDCSPLDHNAAKLLRRISRGEDIRRTMNRSERELVLPALLKRGLAEVSSSGVTTTSVVLAA